MIAAKAMDPVVGIDIHIIQPPGPVPPVPIPHPFIGLLIDPMDFAPIIGATVMVNGMPRATAGTGGKCVPSHIPIGGTFIKPPGNECEVFMGSSTVLADADPLSFLGMPALSCHDIGMPPPPRLKKKRTPKSLVLPTSVVMAIPAGPPVLVGGPPTISMMALGMRAGMAGLGRLRRLQRGSRRMRGVSDRIQAAARRGMDRLGVPPSVQNRVHRAICTVTGHPVDVATGKVFTDAVDFELPGPIPFRWERVWYSCSTYQGPLGHGWHHSYDLALVEEDGAVVVRLADGRAVAFPALEPGEEHFDRRERLTLLRNEDGYRLRDRTQLVHRFDRIQPWSAEQRLVAIEDRNSNRIQFQYDAQERLSAIQDSAGRGLVVQYDAQGRIAALHAPSPSPSGRSFPAVTYGYSIDGDLIKVRDALGNPFRYEYAHHLLSKETDRTGLSFRFEYDGTSADARCLRTWGDGGIFARQIRYDDEEGTTTVVDSRGARTLYHRNELGLVTRTEDASGAVWTVEWNEHAEKVSQTDPLGGKEEHVHDERGRIVSSVDATGATTTVHYDDRGNVVGLTDPTGAQWHREHDARGNVTASVDPLGNTTHYRVDARGLPVEITDPTGRHVRIEWDAAANLTRFIDPWGGETHLAHDMLGRLVQRLDEEGGRTRIAWDLCGRMIGLEDAEARLSSFAYDAGGNLVQAVNPAGNTRRYSYGPLGVLTGATEPGGAVTRYRYDTENDLVRLHDAGGRPWRFERDRLGRVVEERDITGRWLRYGYDAAGQMTESANARGERTRLLRDAAGRLRQRSLPDGTEETFRYDEAGRLVEARNPAATIEFDFDPLGRMVRESLNGQTVENRYDPAGRRVERTSPWGRTLRFEEDLQQRTWTVTDGETFLMERHFDRVGREVRRRMPSGLESLRSYSRTGELLESRTRRGTTTLLERQYGYDEVGQLSEVHDGRFGTTRFQHDLDGRLKSALYPEETLQTFLFDEAGNVPAAPVERSLPTGSPAGPHSRVGIGTAPERVLERVVMAEGWRLVYDADRRLIAKENRGERWEFRYNAADRLSEVISPAAASTSFVYDALNRRIGKISGGVTTEFFWDGDRLLGERASEGEPREYVLASENFAPLAVLGFSDDLLIETDQVGTPWAAFSGSTGSRVWDVRVDAWGTARTATSSPGTLSLVPFRFQGQYADEETGLYYNRFRYYDPAIRGYTQIDPLGLSGGAHLHNYVRSPVGWIDPYGLTGCENVDLTGHRRDHILNRHRAGAGKPGKTEFPASWDDERILHEVSDIATDPGAAVGLGKWDSPFAIGSRDGVDIRVDFYPDTHPTHAGKISTAYPINVAPNPP